MVARRQKSLLKWSTSAKLEWSSRPGRDLVWFNVRKMRAGMSDRAHVPTRQIWKKKPPPFYRTTTV